MKAPSTVVGMRLLLSHGLVALMTLAVAKWLMRPEKDGAEASASNRPLPPIALKNSEAPVLPQASLVSGISAAQGEAPGPMSDWAALMANVQKSDAKGCLAALKDLELTAPGTSGLVERQLWLARYASLDPETALSYTETITGDERQTAISTVLGTWAAKDPEAASTHLESEQLSGGIASKETIANAQTIAAQWAKKDPAAASEWVANLPVEVRGEAISGMVSHLAATDPKGALSMVQLLPQGFERAEAMAPLAMTWARLSPESAAKWATNLGDAQEQSHAVSGVTTAWMSRDAAAASRWVAELPQGGVRDAAVASLVKANSLRNDPEAATLWADSIQNASLRETVLKQALQKWKLHDASAAESWAQSRNAGTLGQ